MCRIAWQPQGGVGAATSVDEAVSPSRSLSSIGCFLRRFPAPFEFLSAEDTHPCSVG